MILDRLLTLASSFTYDGTAYTYDTISSSDLNTISGDAFFAFFAAFLISFLVFGVGIYVLCSVLTMKLFRKFDVEGWKAWVPFVNTWTFLELGGQHGWWQFVPVANFIFLIIAAYNIGLKFNKGGGFVVLYIFLPIIWFIIMALKSTTLSGSSEGEIGIGGLGVGADQTVFAKPAGSVGSATVSSAGTATAEDFTKPAPTESVVQEENSTDETTSQITGDTVEASVEPVVETSTETAESPVDVETPTSTEAPTETTVEAPTEASEETTTEDTTS